MDARPQVFTSHNLSTCCVEIMFMNCPPGEMYFSLLPEEAIRWAENIKVHAGACIEPRHFRYEPS